jgi:WD40 repeat protein
VQAVALGSVGGREVIVSGSHDSTVRVWDAGSGQPIGEPLSGHTGAVQAVAVGSVGGREAIVSGSSDKTARVWDYAVTDAAITVDVQAPVDALGLIPHRILCVAAGPGLCTFGLPTRPIP